MKKVLMFLILSVSLALVACGSNGSDNGSANETGDTTQAGSGQTGDTTQAGSGQTGSGQAGSGQTGSGQDTNDLTAADIPDKEGYDKSGYRIAGTGDKIYIYKKDGKIMAFTLKDSNNSEEYTVSYYDGSDNPTIASGYGKQISGDEAKEVINKLNNKERVKRGFMK